MENSRYYIPISWVRPGIEAEVASRAWEAALLAASSLPSFFTLSLQIEGGAGAPTTAGLVIDADEIASAKAIAERVTTIISSFTGFMGFNIEAGKPKTAEPHGSAIALDIADGDGRRTVFNASPPWRAAMKCAKRISMEINLHHVDDADDAEDKHALCSIRLFGDPEDVHMVAGMVAIDTPGQIRLGVTQNSNSVIEIPLSMVAHIMASTCRIKGAFSALPLDHAEEIHSLFDQQVHGLALGATGGGKSTFLVWRAIRGLSRGRQQIVFAIEPEFAADIAAAMTRQGVEFDCLDFGAEHPPNINVCEPPKWMKPLDYVTYLCNLITSSHQGDLTYEMHGPVGQRILRSLVSLLVMDPASYHPLTCLDDLVVSNELPDYADHLLARIEDPNLLRQFREARAAITRDRESHIGLWVASKTEPLLSNAQIRQIIDVHSGSIELERLLDGRSLLVILPESILGVNGCKVLATVILNQLRLMIRHHRSKALRDIDIIIDEAQFFPYETLRDIYTTDRKLGVNLLCSTQTLARFDTETRACVVGNSGAVGVFRLGQYDAHILADRFTQLSEGGLQRLAKFHMAATNSSRDLYAEMQRKPDAENGWEEVARAHQRTQRTSPTPVWRASVLSYSSYDEGDAIENPRHSTAEPRGGTAEDELIANIARIFGRDTSDISPQQSSSES